MSDLTIEARGQTIPVKLEVAPSGETATFVAELGDRRFRSTDWATLRKTLLEETRKRAAKLDVRFADCDTFENGKRVIVLHLGDHDPSGIDMTRDIKDRLRTFTTQDFLNDNFEEVRLLAGLSMAEAREGVSAADIRRAMAARTAFPDELPIEVRRIALNMDQIEEYGPPPNPAKMTDSRVEDYIERFGRESWELDALDPSTLVELIQGEIREAIDFDRWEAHDETQAAERERLQFVADNWARISAEYDDQR